MYVQLHFDAHGRTVRHVIQSLHSVVSCPSSVYSLSWQLTRQQQEGHSSIPEEWNKYYQDQFQKMNGRPSDGSNHLSGPQWEDTHIS
jgi:hypothetical protein